MKEIRKIVKAYEDAMRQRRNVVLATVVHIEGSAYRAPGARMLVAENGTLMGAVSGGCLEGDVLRKALLAMAEMKPALVTYDTSDDNDAAGLGVSLGCNGIIRILLEPIDGDKVENPVSLLRRAVDRRRPAVIVTFFTPDDRKFALQGSHLLVDGEGVYSTGATLPVELTRLDADIRQVFAMRSSSFVQYAPGSMGEGTINVFFEYLAPGPALVVAGAGNDVRPLVETAEMLGWDITLVDGRPGYASQTRFPTCQVKVARADEALRSIVIDNQTAVVLMSHNYEYDKAVLIQALGGPAKYIGILGPQKKKERLWKEMREEGILLTAEQQDRIYGPTGLDIGAETPEEIALSVISEIKAVFAGRSGGMLRRNPVGKIHQRSTRIAEPMERYGVLLLAAGESTRLGAPKQYLIYRGDSLLRNAVRTAVELRTAATVVVAGKDPAIMRAQLKDLPAEVFVNDGYAEGMASSIREGVRYFTERHPRVTHILILLCDQPYMDVPHLRNLIHRQQLTAASVTASHYADRKGAPALFERAVFPQLLNLTGDTGARHIIESLGNSVEVVPFPGGVIDIDTLESYQRLTGKA